MSELDDALLAEKKAKVITKSDFPNATDAQIATLNKYNQYDGFGVSGVTPELREDEPEGGGIWVSSDGELHDTRRASGGWLNDIVGGFGEALWGGDRAPVSLALIVVAYAAAGLYGAAAGGSSTAGGLSTAEELALAAGEGIETGAPGMATAGGLSTAEELALAAGEGIDTSASGLLGTTVEEAGSSGLLGTDLVSGGAMDNLSLAEMSGYDLSPFASATSETAAKSGGIWSWLKEGSGLLSKAGLVKTGLDFLSGAAKGHMQNQTAQDQIDYLKERDATAAANKVVTPVSTSTSASSTPKASGAPMFTASSTNADEQAMSYRNYFNSLQIPKVGADAKGATV